MKLSPITQRRLQNFVSNKRAFYALWIFLSLFIICLFAEVIANDKPLVVRYNNKFYLPLFHKDYTEITFGGDLDLEIDYHDSYTQELITKNGGWMIWPPIRFKYDTVDYNLERPSPAPPSRRHILGTDDQAHDIVALIIYGFRISVFFGLTLTIMSSTIGIMAGAVQGYFGGKLDILMQRFIEIWTSMPTLYLIIIITSIIKPTFGLLLLILLLFSWLSLEGVVRAEFLRTRNFEYIRAARAVGVKHFKIMFKHILPNAMTAALTFLPFILNSSIIALTSLDFLGFGLPVGSPSLGRLLAQGKANIYSPWIGIATFIVLATMLSLLIFIGEGVRDALDPRKNLA